MLLSGSIVTLSVIGLLLSFHLKTAFACNKIHKIFLCFPEQKGHKELIPLVRKSSSPSLVTCQTSNHISSQHKRKLRSIALCPVNDQLFVTR